MLQLKLQIRQARSLHLITHPPRAWCQCGRDSASIQLPGLHPLILSSRGIAACFHLLFDLCNKILRVGVEVEQREDMDELVTQGLARVQETPSSIVDSGNTCVESVNQVNKSLYYSEPEHQKKERKDSLLVPLPCKKKQVLNHQDSIEHLQGQKKKRRRKGSTGTIV